MPKYSKRMKIQTDPASVKRADGLLFLHIHALCIARTGIDNA